MLLLLLLHKVATCVKPPLVLVDPFVAVLVAPKLALVTPEGPLAPRHAQLNTTVLMAEVVNVTFVLLIHVLLEPLAVAVRILVFVNKHVL